MILSLLFSQLLFAKEFLVKVPNATPHFQYQSKTKFQPIYKIDSNQNIDQLRKSLVRQFGSDIIVEPNYIYSVNRVPNDKQYSDLWGMKAINAERAWQRRTDSSSITVAVIDTGIERSHRDLKKNLWTNKAEKNGKWNKDDDGNGLKDDVHGYDFYNDDKDPTDDEGHGTHCAGSIGAIGDNSRGVVGVSWKADIMAVKFLSASGNGDLEGAVNAIDYAVNSGAKILSNSWGCHCYSVLLRESIVRARDKGVLFVAAAGNEGSDNDRLPHFPSGYALDNVMSVAASNEDGKKAGFSNFGEKRVDIIAPGNNIMSTELEGTYKNSSGTSMATPHVAGAAALLWAENPDWTYLQVKEHLINTSRPQDHGIPHLDLGEALWTDYQASESEWKTKEVLIESPHPYPANKTLRYYVEVAGASRLKLFFEQFALERDFDVVKIFDEQDNLIGTLSGPEIWGEQYTPVVPGSRARIELTSDEDYNYYGFKITKVAYQ